MKAYGRMDVLIHIFLNSALVGGEWWSASRCGRFTTGERDPGTHRMKEWVGLIAGLDDVEKREFLPYWDSNSDTSVFQSVASRYTDCAAMDPLNLGTLIKSCTKS
jgi:hypothetical protein